MALNFWILRGRSVEEKVVAEDVFSDSTKGGAIREEFFPSQQQQSRRQHTGQTSDSRILSLVIVPIGPFRPGSMT